MSAHEFQVHQAEDTLPTRKLGIIAFVSFMIGICCVGISTMIGAPGIGATRATVPVAPPRGFVEQTLVDVTRRGPDLAREQRKTLDSYGWVDREHGIARIPIDRAIDLTVEAAK